MEAFQKIFPCFSSRTNNKTSHVHVGVVQTAKLHQQVHDNADEIVRALFCAEKNGEDLRVQLNQIRANSGVAAYWQDKLAAAVLEKLLLAIERGDQMGFAMREAFEKAKDAAVDFVHDHPCLTALIAIGVLTLMWEWALVAIGFGMDGPIEGSLAAAYQSRYLAGFIDADSWFAFFQRLGMKPRSNTRFNFSIGIQRHRTLSKLMGGDDKK